MWRKKVLHILHSRWYNFAKAVPGRMANHRTSFLGKYLHTSSSFHERHQNFFETFRNRPSTEKTLLANGGLANGFVGDCPRVVWMSIAFLATLSRVSLWSRCMSPLLGKTTFPCPVGRAQLHGLYGFAPNEGKFFNRNFKFSSVKTQVLTRSSVCLQIFINKNWCFSHWHQNEIPNFRRTARKVRKSCFHYLSGNPSQRSSRGVPRNFQ